MCMGRMILTRLGGETAPQQEIVESRLILRQSDLPGPYTTS